MSPDGFSKPYLNAWLKRTRKQLAASGKLSELVLILSKNGGQDESVWRNRLQSILDGEEEPSFDVLTEIDSVLARPGKTGETRDQGAGLFG